jgi:hypothetical protein
LRERSYALGDRISALALADLDRVLREHRLL